MFSQSRFSDQLIIEPGRAIRDLFRLQSHLEPISIHHVRLSRIQQQRNDNSLTIA